MKKRILLAPELKSAHTGLFFQKAGYELHSDYDSKLTYDFIVDDYKPELKNHPRIQVKPELNPQCLSQVRAKISEDFLAQGDSSILLARYYADFNDFNLVDYYSSQYKNIYTLKIQDFLNIGYFIDTIVVESYKQKFDQERIRNYLNQIIPLALKTVETQANHPHLDVSFSFSEIAFAVQVCFESPIEAVKKDHPTVSALADNSNFFDFTFFSKRKKASYSAAWFKKDELKNLRSYFVTEVATHNVAEMSLAQFNPIEEPDRSIAYEPKKAADQSKKLQLARKFSLFIKNYRDKEESPKEAAALEIADINQYLEKYPRQESLNELDDEIKNFIIKLIRDDDLFKGLSDYVQKISASNLDEHVEEIQRVIGEKSLDEVADILRVKGSKDEQGNEKTIVGGWTESLDEEEWKVKRSEIVEQIKEEVTVIKSQGRNVVEDDIIKVMSQKLNANPQEMKNVLQGIVEEAITSTMIQKEGLEGALQTANTQMTAAAVSKPAAPAFDAAKEKLEQQILRMKKLMEQMKNEMVRLKNENASLPKLVATAPAEGDGAEVIELKRALDKALELAKNKEKMAEKIKTDMEGIVQAKNDRIAALEMRIESIKSDFANSTEFANEEKLEKLQVENKSLLARLELANRKINIISDNMDKQESEAAIKKDREILTLKTLIQAAQAVIEKMKSEKSELENKLLEEREKASKVKEGRPVENKDKILELEATISSLNAEKKSLEEKTRLQGMELKKAEQKLKFTSAQLDEAQRKKNPPAGATNNKSNVAYIKQLEQANARLAEASSDLAEKKKELHKLKQENAIMNSKIAELEKKLANAEKKAA